MDTSGPHTLVPIHEVYVREEFLIPSGSFPYFGGHGPLREPDEW